MDDADRFRLLGTYRTHRFRIGQRVCCQVRGEVIITGMTDAPIPWPIGRLRQGRALVVYKGLAKAIRRESNQAVCHSWGVTPQTVSKWRKILSVPRATPGTSRLHRTYAASDPVIIEGRRKAHAKARDPERCHKIAEAKRGKPRPPHVREAMLKASLGRRHSEESRRKMSVAHCRRGTLVPGTIPWTAEEDALVRTLPAEEVARRTGRSLSGVYARRRRLRVPDGRRTDRRQRLRSLQEQLRGALQLCVKPPGLRRNRVLMQDSATKPTAVLLFWGRYNGGRPQSPQQGHRGSTVLSLWRSPCYPRSSAGRKPLLPPRR
jgi:hypothetical protein